jgi:hypothetical protein
MSPGPSATGSRSPPGSSQQVPWSTTWKATPVVAGYRRPQGARTSVRAARGRPLRMAARASASRSTAAYRSARLSDDRT